MITEHPTHHLCFSCEHFRKGKGSVCTVPPERSERFWKVQRFLWLTRLWAWLASPCSQLFPMTPSCPSKCRNWPHFRQRRNQFQDELRSGCWIRDPSCAHRSVFQRFVPWSRGLGSGPSELLEWRRKGVGPDWNVTFQFTNRGQMIKIYYSLSSWQSGRIIAGEKPGHFVG